MPIISFGFDKISAERKALLKKQDKVKNSIRITGIEKAKIRLSNEEKEAVNVSFEFSVDYSSAGKVEFLGHIIYYGNPEQIEGLNDNWTKNKKVDAQFGAMVYNFILTRVNLKALQLEEEVGLPLHLRLPRVKISK